MTAGITGATRVYLHLAHPSAVSRLAAGTLVCDIVTRPARTRLLDEAAARRCVPHPGLPMLAGQVDLILEFLGLGGHRRG